MSTHVWMRHEARDTERRAPLVPADVHRLVDHGLQVTVEESPQRVFPIAAYAAAGAVVTPPGSWVESAPDDAWVLGVKELPDAPETLRHRHIYFAHAFKGQEGADTVLARFERGSRGLLDLEYLTDTHGRRVVAFGHWAGYVGAALGVLALRARLPGHLAPTTREELDDLLVRSVPEAGPHERALVTGALGRSGRGAAEALRVAGLEPTRWDVAETADLDKAALLGHDLVVNCVAAHGPVKPFVTHDDLAGPLRLQVVADVTCDVTSEANMLPVNSSITTWDAPARRVGPIRVIAVDNLPSLLPREASTSFSADLTPLLLRLHEQGVTGPWAAALTAYEAAVGR